jgi:hypothetical protein
MRRHREIDPEWDAFWTWRRVAWWHIHDILNHLARHRRRSHWLWRANDWAAHHWTRDYIAWRVSESERGRTWPREQPHAGGHRRR